MGMKQITRTGLAGEDGVRLVAFAALDRAAKREIGTIPGLPATKSVVKKMGLL